jgi:riboflavin kinase / FMN adenylyltransferase
MDLPEKLHSLPKINSQVQPGSKRGRAMGIHTLNQKFPDGCELAQGVYAALVEIGGETFQGVTHIGPASTFGETEVKVETHVFDFNEEVYGKTATVYFVKHLRDVAKFDSTEELVAQINQDIAQARAALQKF